MCGFAGALERDTSADRWQEQLTAMGDRLIHRGPDDAGNWFDPAAGIGLAHRRLAVIDVSPLGHQPMVSCSGRFVIAFNGEIYNFEALRADLAGENIPWRGHSDTEVLLAAVETWGLPETLRRAVGMFAFALWDRRDRELHLVRDRMGIKPLYYGWCGHSLLFGSELKALRAHPRFTNPIDRNSVAAFLRHNYIPAPWSIHEGICKQQPGTILTFGGDRFEDRDSVRETVYWSLETVAEQGMSDPFTGSSDEAVEALDRTLHEAVGCRMIADVPLGAFLSGGIDSSAVVALMQAQSSTPVKTFTIGFEEQGYNEADHARRIAHHLGTDHTELTVTPEQARNVIPLLPAMFDEPFADSSQIPTWLVSDLARRSVTVSLSGDGGDELFAGYLRYGTFRDLYKMIGWCPGPLRQLAGKTLAAIPGKLLDGALGWLPLKFERYGSGGKPGDKLHKLAEMLKFRSPAHLYLDLLSHWKQPAELVPGSVERPNILWGDEPVPDFSDRTSWMMYLDSRTYLPDDILTKVDRASMHVSLEARVPVLDHRVVELAWRLPTSMKLRDGGQKWALRQVLYKYVPRELMDRPKMGFGIPIDHWLRGPLRDWAEAYLDEDRLRRDGWFDPAPIRRKWAEHLSGERDWQYYLWDVLMFEAWREAL
ncbi:MAG: asparagine synthase (glutamine-hydrolyzing) [Acidobacteria bacterium]|uniref:asparagine synthase (glutamine-hydrolyzing) n=1 Tax=Candidatus Polarisedimenticola svalbardensis TaxID=2886004 RepID=A0A8J6Y675_9BACT|nr:asparagine synthase (glutamine-hydrolyzing) [Candidatus Polarisedimenticola svalbardensis]